MSDTITILSPLDLKPGATNPQGQVVATATLYANGPTVVVGGRYTDGELFAFQWPSGSGWTVNGRTGA